MRSRKTDYSTFKHNVMNEVRRTRESLAYLSSIQ